MPDLRFERKAGAPLAAVAGIDEAGRGPLAGPVYAAAVILPPRGLPRRIARRIDDSKALSAETRCELAPLIQESCQVGVGVATVEEIDAVNILQATFLAMCRAVAALPTPPEVALVDGNRVPPALACPAQAVIEGDRKSLSIAAASIVAKVLRDQVMAALAEECPGYGWERNAGYATAEHRHALIRLGPTRHHRRSFSPVYQQLSLTL